jgi:hypothetical protein
VPRSRLSRQRAFAVAAAALAATEMGELGKARPYLGRAKPVYGDSQDRLGSSSASSPWVGNGDAGLVFVRARGAAGASGGRQSDLRSVEWSGSRRLGPERVDVFGSERAPTTTDVDGM